MTNCVILIDERDVLRYFQQAGAQAPFGIATGLNRLGELGTAAGRDHVRKAFDVRSESALRFALPVVIPGALRATKKNLRVIIEPENIGKIYNAFELGEVHGRDRLGRYPAVPTSALRITEKTVIPRQMYPVNLGLEVRADPSGRAYYGLGKNSIKRRLTPLSRNTFGQIVKQGKLGTYEVPSRKNPGDRLIFQRRQGPGYRGGVLLWVIKQSVPRPPILELYKTINRVVSEQFLPVMEGAIAFALRTAK